MDTILGYINKINVFGVDIYFYAFFILGGALVALFLSSFRAHEKGYPWSLFDTVFILALPLGIIGARMWYVIAEWEQFASNPMEIFAFRDGGLAIQGGALLGAASGIIFCLIRRKGMDVLEIADFAVPTILVAQAIGRWGNFFNQEVYGQTVSSSAWWLPSFVQNQMVIGGSYKAPLYFLEGVINLGGFILLGRVIPTLMGKNYKHGDVTFAYFVFYGIVRVVLEPVRDSQFNMGGEDNMRAVYMAIAYVGGGLLLILINHLIRFKLEKDPDFFKRMIKSKK